MARVLLIFRIWHPLPIFNFLSGKSWFDWYIKKLVPRRHAEEWLAAHHWTEKALWDHLSSVATCEDWWPTCCLFGGILGGDGC